MIFNCRKFRDIENMFQGILKQAAEVISPSPTPYQEIEYHWKQVKKFYAEINDAPPRHISSTNLPHHLESILQAVIVEDNIETISIETDPSKTSSTSSLDKECINFILTSRPIDLLLQLSISDNPPGIKICVLNWLRRFLTCLKNPPLDHQHIYQPLRNFIRICNGKVPSPYEEEEILFLETVAGLIRKNPNLLDKFISSHQYSVNSLLNSSTKIKKLPTKNTLFQCTKIESNIRRVEIIPDTNGGSCSKSSSSKIDESSCDTKSLNKSNSLKNFSNSPCDCEDNERFHLLDAILTYTESPDSKIVVRACEAALILTSLPTLNMNCTSVAKSLEDFTNYLNQKLIILFEKIPEDMDSDNLEDASVSWGLIPREPDDNRYVGKSQVYEYLRWFDYTDCVTRECAKVAEQFESKFRTEFLLRIVEPSLIATDTPFVLVLLSKMIKQIRSPKLMDEFAIWLVGETITSEMYSSTDCLLTIIIENVQDNSEILLSGLQFIEALLDNPHEQILNEMIFRYINKRGYYDMNNARKTQSWSDEEDDRERRRNSIEFEEHTKSKTFSPHNILKVINNFLFLLPRQFMAQSTGTCYEEYIQDASRHYKVWSKKTNNFVWPREAISPERDQDVNSISSSKSPSLDEFSHARNVFRQKSSSDSCVLNIIELQCNDSGISEECFFEGPLLKLLFSHLKNMAIQPCEINLAIIAILSKLAFFPHPYLHEILLNPEIPVSPGTTTLWNSLQFVARQLLLKIPQYEDFQKRIAETSKRLLSNLPLIGCEDDEEKVNNIEMNVTGADEDIESVQLFEAVVILEEFCKELAAIAFVKYHHATE